MADGGFGIFNGEGAEEQFEVKQLPSDLFGVHFRVNCDRCGNTQVNSIEWQQIADAAKVPQTSPPKFPRDPVTGHEWAYDGASRRMWPQIGCTRCRHILGPSITPGEAARMLGDGISSGLVRPG